MPRLVVLLFLTAVVLAHFFGSQAFSTRPPLTNHRASWSTARNTLTDPDTLATTTLLEPTTDETLTTRSMKQSSSASTTIVRTTTTDNTSLESIMLDQQRQDYSSFLNPTMGRLLVIVAAAIYGTNFATVKLLDQVMPLALSASLRFSLAAVVVTGIVLANEQTNSSSGWQPLADNKDRIKAMWCGAEVGVWYCIAYISQAYGLHTADASKSAFFNALAVIVVPLLDSFFRGKKLQGRCLASVAMAIGGVAMLQLGPNIADANLLSTTPGDMFCLAQALFFGIGYWRLESASIQYPDQAGRMTAGQLLAVAGGSILFWLAGDGGVSSLAQLQNWLTDPFILASLGWTGLFSTALALYMETVALKVVTASELTILMTSVSLWGSAFAYVTMGEVLPPIGMLGGLAILAGCVLSSMDNQTTET